MKSRKSKSVARGRATTASLRVKESGRTGSRNRQSGTIPVQVSKAGPSKRGIRALDLFRQGVQAQLADLARREIRTATTINGRAVHVIPTKEGRRFVLVEEKTRSARPGVKSCL